MPAPRGKLTDLPEISAYVLAHAAGIAWGATVNPLIFRSLITQGQRNLMLSSIAVSIAVSVVVLLGNRPASLWIVKDFGCCASG